MENEERWRTVLAERNSRRKQRQNRFDWHARNPIHIGVSPLFDAFPRVLSAAKLALAFGRGLKPPERLSGEQENAEWPDASSGSTIRRSMFSQQLWVEPIGVVEGCDKWRLYREVLASSNIDSVLVDGKYLWIQPYKQYAILCAVVEPYLSRCTFSQFPVRLFSVTPYVHIQVSKTLSYYTLYSDMISWSLYVHNYVNCIIEAVFTIVPMGTTAI